MPENQDLTPNKWAIVTVDIVHTILAIAWCTFVLGGTCWLILQHDWSKWWILAAVLLCSTSRFKNPFIKKSEKDSEK